MPVKKYCGNDANLPEGYAEFGDLFTCTRKGFGICKYTGKLGTKYNGQPPNPDRPKIYCGNKDEIPPGYTRKGTRNECLKRGFGRCLYTEPEIQQQLRAPMQAQLRAPMQAQLRAPMQAPRQQTQRQFAREFLQRYQEQSLTRTQIQRIFNRLTEQQKAWFNTNLVVSQDTIHGFFKIQQF